MGRTVRSARAGIGAGETDLATVLRREAQLLVGYPESPLVGEDVHGGLLDGGPVAGQRAPDATGLTQDPVSYPIRLHELLRHSGHTLLLSAATAPAAETQLQSPPRSNANWAARSAPRDRRIGGTVRRDVRESPP